ncbi:hypothetical protein [Marisediminitalea sp.]|uniref:hypothetical protein n=1 Tax=Marisediminitalea sp. TaxID=2662268 RepID=UPI003378215B|nr:RHS repeat protein [Aestuariibacter sp.]MCP4233238.1 RHS repeat protein [Aestuariibacter sp.]MCP4524425.1 RHS repeat protein [Aestuariibacter sp.]MCP4947597.1 RHS repeat protein [Aestuariibacter sp.]MCP5010191.1 RHS repeat protein [Aestuariibacter sp.]
MKNHLIKVVKCCAFLMFTNAIIPQFSYAASYVKGHIDSPGDDYENFYLKGWACQTGKNVSLNTHVYFDGRGGVGQIYRGIMANNSSEQGVANACSNNLYKNRFKYKMPLLHVYQNRGRTIYIHGISSIGSGNKLLTNSGKYKVPNIPTSKVLGYIDVLSKSGSDYYISGWACQKYFKTSINVHVYAGGAAGQGGTMIASGSANLASGSGIATECGTSGTKYKFNIKLPSEKVQQHAQKALYVHGISLVGTGNLTIANSGTFKLPFGNGPISIKYTYDALGRLQTVEDPKNGDREYTFDKAGNRKAVTKD